jgi:hypothetical protein
MDADLDLLLTTVFVTADDLLPKRTRNAARRVTDAEVVTLCVAQAIMGIPSDRRFLAVAGKRLGHLFPQLPKQSGYFKRRRRLAETLEWLMGIFASQSPGFYDDLLLIDSTPVECARSRETVKRSALGDAADYGWCASHSRYFWGFRLHAIFSPDGTPRALELTSPKLDERDVGLVLLDRVSATAAKHCSVTAATPAARSLPRSAIAMPRSCAPAARTSAGSARTSLRSDKGSNRSSGPAKTSSRSNGTAPAPSPASANASSHASAASPPLSLSTTNSDAQAVPSSTTAPNRAESII